MPSLQRYLQLSLMLLLAAGSAMAQRGTTFVLATTGCAKKHCTQMEHDAVGLGTPTTTTGSLSLYTPNSGPNPIGDGDGKGDGCSSNGSMFACTSTSSPFLKVFGQNGDMIYNSCGGTDPTNPTQCTVDKFNDTITTPLIGQDGSVVAADNTRMIRFYSATSFDRTKYSQVPALQGLPTLKIPQGLIYTQAPNSTGALIGLITLLVQNGPVITFDSGNLGNASDNYGFVGMDLPGNGTPCDNPNGCFYAGTNSACAVPLFDGSGNIAGGRIYAAMNQDSAVSITPTENEQYYGRVYALTITATGASPISETWYYDFVGAGIVGPSGASPMCSPDGGIFLDYGSIQQNNTLCVSADVPAGTSCGAGVLGLVDCDGPNLRPGACNGVNTPYALIYQYPIASLPTDAPGHTTGATNAGLYINSNYSYDSKNGCFWVRQYGTSTMSCVSTTAESVLSAINVASLYSSYGPIFAASNVSIAKAPTGDTLAMLGARTTTAHGAYHMVLGIDTGVCGGPTCCTNWVSYGSLSCPSSWSTAPTLPWSFNLTAQSAGDAPGQFTVINSVQGVPCLVAFTDETKGTWLLTTPGEAKAGCSTPAKVKP